MTWGEWPAPWWWGASLSAAAFLAAGHDKAAARRGSRRLSERFLLGLAAAGGSPGLVLGMIVWRHKTVKARFVAAVAAVVTCQTLLAAWIAR